MLEAAVVLQSHFESKAMCGELSSLEKLYPEWRELCEEGPSNVPFYRPEWFESFVSAFLPSARLRLLTARSASRLRAVLPLVEQRSLFVGMPAKVLRSPTNYHSNRFDIAVGSGDAAEAVEAVWEMLQKDSSWDVIELQYVPEDGWGRYLTELAKKAGYPTGLWEAMNSPYVAIPPSAKTFEEAVGPDRAKSLSGLRKKKKKLEQQGIVTLDRITHATPDILEEFYSMEAASWKGTKNTAISSDEATKKFYDSIAAAASRHGYLDFRVLRCGGEAAAMNYALTLGGTHYIPKITYASKFAVVSPGQLLMREVLGDLAAQGIRELDFLGPVGNWKSHWTRRTREHVHCYIFRRGPKGRLLWALKFHGARRARIAKRAVTAFVNRLQERLKAKKN